MASADRRIHSRFPFNSRLEVRPRPAASFESEPTAIDLTAQATAIDVSVGGLGFRTKAPFSIGDFIRVSLRDAERYSLDSDGLGAESPTAPRPASGGISFEVEAVVRHVQMEDGDYLIGAERRPSA